MAVVEEGVDVGVRLAHLPDSSLVAVPVGVGAMVLASTVSIAAYLGLLGATAQAFSALVACIVEMAL